MEVVITTVTGNGMRQYFRQLVRDAVVLNGCDHPLMISDAEPLERFLLADKRAKVDVGDFYIICDDDCLPATPSAFERAIEILEEFDEIGILGLAWKRGLRPDDMGAWKKSDYFDVDDESFPTRVWEVDHVGGIIAVRKGALANPAPTAQFRTLDLEHGIGDDQVLADIVRANGFKVCITSDVWFHHLGEGFSVIWPKKEV